MGTLSTGTFRCIPRRCFAWFGEESKTVGSLGSVRIALGIAFQAAAVNVRMDSFCPVTSIATVSRVSGASVSRSASRSAVLRYGVSIKSCVSLARLAFRQPEWQRAVRHRA